MEEGGIAQFAAAKSLVSAAKDASDIVDNLQSDVQERLQICKGLSDIAVEFEESEIEIGILDKRTASTLATLAELRDAYSAMMGEYGNITIFEIQKNLPMRGTHSAKHTLNVSAFVV
jgi:hypothetical protein